MTVVTTMATQNKLERIDVRVSEQVKEDFTKVAEYHGLKAATLLHSMVVKRINDERREHPEIFESDNAITLQQAQEDDKRKSKR